MGKTCRYVVNALGKGGETYYTQCRDKQELKRWIHENKEKINMQEIKITDKNQTFLSKLLGLNRVF
ncbi:hypothetical protein [Neobacillus sp. Marseille-QA0830]